MPERPVKPVYRRARVLVSSLLLLAGLAAWLAWARFQAFLETPLDLPPDGHVFMLAPGSSGSNIVQQLAAEGFTRPGWQWKLLMRLDPHVYRSGEYQLRAGMRPRQVLETLASGQVVQYRLTLVEGWTFAQVAGLLQGNAVLEHPVDLSDPANWPGVLSALDLEHPEGWFLPETYQFTRGDSDLDILARAHRSMRSELEQAWQDREEDLPLDSPYELLILASIVEKETGLDSERAEVAGVFVRRLRKGMRLQTDPTVIYGLGDRFDGDIRRRDLEADTPYNTYTRGGLPPTPIAMPGRASLRAAARPADGESLYFVADGKGGHTFSVTLEEHQAAVNKLLRRE
jgi:UPF0755 protein